jgi:hypothetical protein
MNIFRLLGMEGVSQPEEYYDPREEARLGREAIQQSAWKVFCSDRAYRDATANARLDVASAALRNMVSPSITQQLGLETSSPLDKATRVKTRQLSTLQLNKHEAVKDFLLTLKVLVPHDPVFRGLGTTTDDPVARLINRAHEWIVPLETDAVQLDRDYIKQQETNQQG